MNNCEICGKACGEYTLCPDCFKLMQEGKVLKCKNCGHWYKEDEMCKCILAPGTTPPPVSSTSAPAPAPTTENAEIEKKQLGCLGEGLLLIVRLVVISVITIAAIVLVIMYASTSQELEDHPNRYGETSIFTAMFKTPPTITYKDADDLTEATNIILLLKANDDYKEVIIELRIYDANDVIIKTTHLTQTNLTEGETYSLTYNLSLTELVNASYSEASIYKYK